MRGSFRGGAWSRGVSFGLSLSICSAAFSMSENKRVRDTSAATSAASRDFQGTLPRGRPGPFSGLPARPPGPPPGGLAFVSHVEIMLAILMQPSWAADAVLNRTPCTQPNRVRPPWAGRRKLETNRSPNRNKFARTERMLHRSLLLRRTVVAQGCEQPPSQA